MITEWITVDKVSLLPPQISKPNLSWTKRVNYKLLKKEINNLITPKQNTL